jgi:benzodiazapine receptor
MGEIASQAQLRMSFLRWAIVLVPLVLLLGMLSGVLSGSSGDSAWFRALAKPAIMPSTRVFPVAWTILYAAMGLALAIIVHARRAKGRGRAIAFFVAQLALNLAWSPLFFAAHQVSAALWLLVAILLLAAITTRLFFRVRRSAGLLMLPYLAWLCFAAILNYQIDRLNPQAEQLAPEAPSTQIAL